jgi:tetratricopeptide (TPR) repeat protein
MSASQDRFQQAMNQGHSAAWDQTWDRAVGFYQQALAEAPDNPKALTSLGLALLEMQRFDEALECYRRASLIIPNDPLLLEKVAQICEKLGRLNDVIQASLQAADLHMKNREVEKAVENWVQVTRFNGDHLVAHSRLAVVYERMGRRSEAVQEYLWVASIVQRTGADDKALQAINYALQIMPENTNARQALAMLRVNQLLPRPPKGQGGTGPVRANPAQASEAKPGAAPRQVKTMDPVSEARQKALTQLADYLFEQTEERSKSRPIRKSAGAILRGGGEGASPEEAEQVEQAKVLRFLGQAVEEQSQGLDALAMMDLDNAMQAGLSHPAAYFDIGLLASYSAEDPEPALRDLQLAMKYPEFALAAHIVAGQTLNTLGRIPEAAQHYLEALKLADAATAPPEQADDIKQLYDPVIATQLAEMDEKDLTELCKNVAGLLSENVWRENLTQARMQLPPQPEGNPPLLLAEMLLQTRSTQVVESLSMIRQLTQQNMLRTAMEEAYTALQFAPTYLPLHTQIGDILFKEDRFEEAVAKYSVVARAYSVRGEAAQAVNMLRKLLHLSPSDLTLRQQLIEQLINGGQVEDAIRAYMELAEIYYHQMDLERARSTYVTALRLVQNSSANRDWIVDILSKMADIDMQRLDLRQAMRIYEQIRSLHPVDPKVRMTIIALNFRMGQEGASRAEIQNYFAYMEKTVSGFSRAAFIKALAEEHPELSEMVRGAVPGG